MKVLVITIKLRASWVHSLKEKRMIVLSICNKLKNKFNVSVAEVEHQDEHQTIGIGICAVGTSKDIMHSMKEKILDFVEDHSEAEILDIQEEIIDY